MQGARLLRAIEHHDALHGFRNRFEKGLGGERTVETHLHDTDLFAVAVHVIHRLFDRLIDGAHCDDDDLRVCGAVVIEELIIRADLLVDLVHVFLDNARQLVVCGVAGFAALEEDVRILRAAHLARVIRIQRAVLEGTDRIVIHHFIQVLVIPCFDFLNFMGGTEAVEETDEGKSAFDRGHMRDGRQIHDFLNGGGTEHGRTGLAAGIHVRMIAENVERVGGDAACGDVEDARQTLTGTFVNVRDHQQQTLRSRVGGG